MGVPNSWVRGQYAPKSQQGTAIIYGDGDFPNFASVQRAAQAVGDAKGDSPAWAGYTLGVSASAAPFQPGNAENAFKIVKESGYLRPPRRTQTPPRAR